MFSKTSGRSVLLRQLPTNGFYVKLPCSQTDLPIPGIGFRHVYQHTLKSNGVKETPHIPASRGYGPIAPVPRQLAFVRDLAHINLAQINLVLYAIGRKLCLRKRVNAGPRLS